MSRDRRGMARSRGEALSLVIVSVGLLIVAGVCCWGAVELRVIPW